MPWESFREKNAEWNLTYSAILFRTWDRVRLFPIVDHYLLDLRFYNNINNAGSYKIIYKNLNFSQGLSRNIHFRSIITCSQRDVSPPDISRATASAIKLFSLMDSSTALRLELNSLSCSSVPESRAKRTFWYTTYRLNYGIINHFK